MTLFFMTMTTIVYHMSYVMHCIHASSVHCWLCRYVCMSKRLAWSSSESVYTGCFKIRNQYSNSNNTRTIFMVRSSSYLKHCESSPGSCDERSTAPGGCRLWTKPIGLNHRPACRLPVNYTCHRHLLFIHSFIHFNSGSKAHKQQTEAMT